MGGEDILHPDKVTVVADGYSLIRDDGSCDCTLGVSLLMAVYWVYGFQYPKSLKLTFSFLERYIFNLKSTKTTPTAVVRLHTDLAHSLART